MSATQLHERDALDDRDAQIALLVALVRELSDRVTVLEGSEPESVNRSLMMTVQMAAHQSGFSESGIRKLIRENRIGHAWIGCRVFLTELPTRRR